MNKLTIPIGALLSLCLFHPLFAADNGLSSSILLAQADTQEQSQAASDSVEEVYVVGIRKSLQDAADIKRNAGNIVDAISAEDIGKLPDANVAEALRRVTGVQIGVDDTGTGTGFQVRGFSQNRVEINGRTLVSNGDTDARTNSFNTTSSTLFKSIEVIKTPTADMTEGAIGATVKLNTFRPFDFKGQKISAQAKLTSDSLADDDGYLVSGLFSDIYDTGLGEIGVTINASYEEKHRTTDNVLASWQPITGSQPNGLLPDYTVFRPRTINIEQKPFTFETSSLDFSTQWQLNDTTQIYAQLTYTEQSRQRDQSRMNLLLQGGQARLQPGFNLLSYSRPATGAEFVEPSPGVFEPATGDIERGILLGGRFVYPGTNNPARAAANQEFIDEEQLAYAVGAEFELSDTLFMQVEFANSTSDWYRDNVNTSYNPTLHNLVPGIPHPDLVWDFTTGTDLPTAVLDFTQVAAALNAKGVSTNADLLDPVIYTWNNFSGQLTDRNNGERSVKVDFDLDVDIGFFNSFEFGARLAERTVDRIQSRMSGAGWSPNMNGKNGNGGTGIYTNYWLNADGMGAANDGTGTNSFVALDLLNPGLTNGFFVPQGEILTGWSGNITRNWLQPTYNRALWNQIRDVHFPSRDYDPGPDGIACNNPAIHRNRDSGVPADPAVIMDLLVSGDQLARTYLGAGPNADPAFPECADDISAISGWFWNPNESYPYDIEEQTQALYFKANFDSELFGLPVTGNIGVRVVRTEIDAEGRLSEPVLNELGELEDVITTTFAKNDYNNVLPSANINFALRDDMALRFGAARSMARPDPGDLAPSLSIAQATTSGTQGNPDLKPLIATQADVSYEWYLSETNAFSAAVFYKDLADFLEEERFSRQATRDIDGDDLIDENDQLSIKRKFNSGDGTARGVELAYQTVFDFASWPTWAQGFGANINYTFTESSQDSGLNELTGEKLPLPDLSENSYNIILFYENYGFSFRAAFNKRDASYDQQTNGAADNEYFIIDQDKQARGITGNELFSALSATMPQWNGEAESLDISMDYQISPQFTVFLQGTNVTEEPEIKFVGGSMDDTRAKAVWRDAGSFYVLGVRMKL